VHVSTGVPIAGPPSPSVSLDDEQDCVPVTAPARNRANAGPPGKTRVASSFSPTVHRRDAHTRTTPTSQPTTKSTDPTVRNSAAVISRPMPGRR